MRNNHVATVYQSDQVRYAKPVDLVVMLYDKTLMLLKASKQHLLAHNLKEKGYGLLQTIEILTEMQAVLDKQQGGEIAANLDELYGYMLKQLTLANFDNDASKIEEVIGLLQVLREGWQGIATPAFALAAASAS